MRKIKIRVVPKKDLDEGSQKNKPKRYNCNVTKRDTTQEWKKDGKKKKPIEVSVVTTECDLDL